MNSILDSFLRKDFNGTIDICYDMEVEESKYKALSNPQNQNLFYSVFLASYIILEEYASASHLFSRISSQTKNQCLDVQTIWNIGTCMKTNDLAGLKLAFQWPISEEVCHVLNELMVSWKQRQKALVASAYTNISLENFAAMMLLSSEDALQECNTLGWSHETDSNGITFIQPINNVTLHSCYAVEKLVSNATTVETLLNYVNALERPAIKVNVNKANKGKTESGASEASKP